MDPFAFSLIWLIPGVGLAAQMFFHSKQERDAKFWAFIVMVLLLGPLFFCCIVFLRNRD